MTYVELHAHSAYSFLDGASQPERQTSPLFRSSSSAWSSRDGRGSRFGPSRVCACAAVSRRQRFA